MLNPRSHGASENPLRVAIVTASLGRAGAEKQAYYMAKALSEAGIHVRVYNLSRGGEYADALHEIEIESECFGWLPGFPLRLMLLVTALRKFRPNIIQSVHAYTNAYSALAARIFGVVSIGGLRSDVASCLADNGRFARSLLTFPDAIAVNSRSALEQLRQAGMVDPARMHSLPNAIDLDLYPPAQENMPGCRAIFVSRLQPSKRADVFLRALAKARSEEPSVTGTVVGYGPEAEALRLLADELGLDSGAVEFLGFREDISELMQKASMFVFCSESEGTPNVILEALATGLPVITTPAGDAAHLVRMAEAGFVVPFGDVEATAHAMVGLARSPEMRRRLGRSGRDYVARNRSTRELGGLLMSIYADVARMCGREGLRASVDRIPQSTGRLR